MPTHIFSVRMRCLFECATHALAGHSPSRLLRCHSSRMCLLSSCYPALIDWFPISLSLCCVLFTVFSFSVFSDVRAFLSRARRVIQPFIQRCCFPHCIVRCFEHPHETVFLTFLCLVVIQRGCLVGALCAGTVWLSVRQDVLVPQQGRRCQRRQGPVCHLQLRRLCHYGLLHSTIVGHSGHTFCYFHASDVVCNAKASIVSHVAGGMH